MTTAEPTFDSVDIRPARRADILEVYRMECRCFPAPWPYQAFLAHLDAPAFLLATVDETLAGYLVGDVGTPYAKREAHLKDLAVAPDHRRRGIGSQLLEMGLTELAVAGAGGVSLEVRETNDGAQSLYREYGFTADRVERDYYKDGTDAVIMSRSLP